MKKQITALEWLINEIPEIDWSDTYWKLKFEKAKEMEKQQINDAYRTGVYGTKIAEQYYNETFKK